MVSTGLSAAVACAALAAPDPPANVTRTYPDAWPPDYDLAPAADVNGYATTTHSDSTLADRVRRNIIPGAWGHRGLDVHGDGRSAVVTAPADTQAAVERMIAEKSVQVRVEARLLTLRPSQLRAAGLAVPLPGVVAPITAAGVAALAGAAKEAGCTNSLGPPRFTLFNGQRWVCVVETRQAYVSAMVPVVGPGAVRFDPTVSTTPAIKLVEWFKADVSADRRVVWLSSTVQATRLVALDLVPGSPTTWPAVQVPRHQSVTMTATAVPVPTGGFVWACGHLVGAVGGSATRPSSPTPPANLEADELCIVWRVVVLPA